MSLSVCLRLFGSEPKTCAEAFTGVSDTRTIAASEIDRMHFSNSNILFSYISALVDSVESSASKMARSDPSRGQT
jgi:hypothetical protein